MCTLTYRLTQTGYELFFNRDEQLSRTQAIHPKIDSGLNAIYPIDPIGKGTWIAVHQNGCSLALLNYYQAEKVAPMGTFNSRGEIILTLLENADNAIEVLKQMSLGCYQPFLLCVFASDLSLNNNMLQCYQWDGEKLNEVIKVLPITSSGVDYEQVYAARRMKFKQLVSAPKPTQEQLIQYHQSQQEEGKLSVKMSRIDAQTVSFSHIIVNDNITFKYHDYLNNKQEISEMKRSV